MTNPDRSVEEILLSLQERAKELNCLYQVDEILNRSAIPSAEMFEELIRVIPAGWQYPEICRVRLRLEDRLHETEPIPETPWIQHADILVEGSRVGEIEVLYLEKRPGADEGPFLKEERRLINAIAERLGFFIMQRRLREAHSSLESAMQRISERDTSPWMVLLEFLRRTDAELLKRITRKMINYLCWNGVPEGEALLQESLSGGSLPEQGEDNRPQRKQSLRNLADFTDRTFALAAEHLSENELIASIQTWIKEEKSSFLISTLEDYDSDLFHIGEAVERYQGAQIEEDELPVAVRTALKVSLLRRFFTERLDYINVAKKHVNVRDFFDLVQHMIFPSHSQGKLGGKGAGLFLAARILEKDPEHRELFRNIRVPKTWYLASDGVLEFMHHNNLEDLYNRKYMEVERIRQDYHHVIQVFKNSQFPPEVTKGLAVALDDFEDRPLIVRSSSLLEDQVGSAFSGKYKSLFVANQGSKRERLEALKDAIAEVYASIFGPDPIEYRAERGLLDFREEMGIMIQEVVGTRVGRYFLPAFAGVAFGNNEFRWSPRIRREDGLVRMVPGLGTRAVDRLGDDYPVLLAPGQSGLRVNVSPDEIVRYSPKYLDVIDLEKNSFETVEVEALLREVGDDYPLVRQMISMVDHNHVRKPRIMEPDWKKDQFVVTFEGLFTDTTFVEQMRTLLETLREQLGYPVDIEFAHDGEHFHLLQCRAQSYAEEEAPAPIPRDLPREKIVFSANRYISNGRVPDITHIVYVSPEIYAELEDLETLRDVARAVGRLNKLLPKRQFILMGPGRWGSRGDIRLGVSVTYSDINNTAVLMEIARKSGNYLPELSFGTHFFQDLVEADIRYLPLYPDDEGIVFNEQFLLRSANILSDLLPEFGHLENVLRVIDVPRETLGRVLRVLLNAELEEAVGVLVDPAPNPESPQWRGSVIEAPPEDHWRWRLRMAERIAALMDTGHLGVKGLYVFGSTKNATASPNSDLDLIVHFDGTEEQQRELQTWLDGWSRALAEVNFLRTGYASEGLLDVHLVSDEDIARQTSFAAKIGAVTDAARPLWLRGAPPPPDARNPGSGTRNPGSGTRND